MPVGIAAAATGAFGVEVESRGLDARGDVILDRLGYRPDRRTARRPGPLQGLGRAVCGNPPQVIAFGGGGDEPGQRQAAVHHAFFTAQA